MTRGCYCGRYSPFVTDHLRTLLVPLSSFLVISLPQDATDKLAGLTSSLYGSAYETSLMQALE